MESYIQPYSQGYCELCKSRCNPGCNPDCKARSANWRFRFVISPRPCPAGNTVRHTTPPADPSLPTTERGISGRGWQKTVKTGAGGSQISTIKDSIRLQQKGHCGGSNEDGKYQQHTTSKTTSQAAGNGSGHP